VQDKCMVTIDHL